MVSPAIVLFSGGLDSTTCLAIAASMGFEPVLLSFTYGQKHDTAIVPCHTLTRKYGVRLHHHIELPGLGDSSSLVNPALEVPKNKDPRAPGIPSTFVPARNLIFLSYAAAQAREMKARDIFIGCSQIDFSGYPDCRADFLRSFEMTMNVALGNAAADWITLHTPLLYLSKSETIKLGLELGVDYGKTFSCYDPCETADGDTLACGNCDACQLRLEGFRQANAADPLKYLPNLNLLGQN